MFRSAFAALSMSTIANCTRVLARAAAGRLGISFSRSGLRRGAIRRLIRGFVAGLAGMLVPRPEAVLVPVPVRVRSRRR
ncbi:MAG TPA: hypothetical protein VN229_00050 [Terriglobales bacterium]|nr:hypothetical protein [Terriglobales bacterium]